MTEEKKQEQPVEERQDMWYLDGGVLSAAANMVGSQMYGEFDVEKKEPKDNEEFSERACYLMRQMCPIVYAYFMEYHSGKYPLPQGTLDVIKDVVRRRASQFMAGDKIVKPKIILP